MRARPTKKRQQTKAVPALLHRRKPLLQVCQKPGTASRATTRVGSYGIASLQPYTGKWVLDWSRVIESTGSRRQQQWLYRWYSKKYKLVQLKARNASGYAIIDSTQADAGGPPAEFDKKAPGPGPRGPVVLLGPSA
jgi:hypothetical protein